MTITPKISGWSITDLPDIPIFPHVGDQIVSLKDIDKLSKHSAQWIFDTYNLVELNEDVAGCNFGVVMSLDDIRKVSIMEYAPEVEEELANYFNESYGDWRKCYLRFGH